MSWIKCNGVKDIPEGQWLVYLEKPYLNLHIHSARIHHNLSFIGGHFNFEVPKVIAYMELPKYTIED